jgi:hypothetical protein
MQSSTVVDCSQRVSSETQLPKRRQLSLRGLFLSTAYFAVSSALAAKFGLGIFVLMNGVFLAWLSFRGYLWWMQTTRARPKAYGLAWLLFFVSFGLPAFTEQGCGAGTPRTRYGWEAALMPVGMAKEAVGDTATLIRNPNQRTTKAILENLQWLFLTALWNLPNLLMLASPYLLYRQQRGQGRVLSALFGCAAVSSWTWGATSGSDLLIGYYAWSIGITVIALARPFGWRSLATMGILFAIWLALGCFG